MLPGASGGTTRARRAAPSTCVNERFSSCAVHRRLGGSQCGRGPQLRGRRAARACDWLMSCVSDSVCARLSSASALASCALRAGQVRPGARQLRLVGSRIDHEQQLALRHLLAIVEVHRLHWRPKPAAAPPRYPRPRSARCSHPSRPRSAAARRRPPHPAGPAAQQAAWNSRRKAPTATQPRQGFWY